MSQRSDLRRAQFAYEQLDGQSVLIAAGIDPGKRVVVQGAELLDRVR